MEWEELEAEQRFPEQQEKVNFQQDCQVEQQPIFLQPDVVSNLVVDYRFCQKLILIPRFIKNLWILLN